MEVRKTKKIVKEFDEVVESYIECDRCKNKIKSSFYDVFECSFLYKVGNSYPEGGKWDETTMDLCQKCGQDLIVTLNNLGFRLNVKNVDW